LKPALAAGRMPVESVAVRMLESRLQTQPREADVGRPLKKIDPNQVFKLARIGCTNDEIGAILGIDGDRIRVRFQRELIRGRGRLRSSLRRKQYLRAVKDGSDTMLIHLGKHLLDQHDRVKSTLEHTGELKVIVEYTDGDPDPAGDPFLPELSAAASNGVP
jgi:hypothetical protein